MDMVLRTPLGDIAALSWGADPFQPTAARVLCLHGWLDNAASFHIFAPLLVAALGGVTAASVVAIDLPGHGLSCRFDFYSSGAFAVAVAASLDVLKWRTAVLVGHAAGGGVALIVAGALPERVVGLALLESPGPPIRDAASAPALLKAAVAALSVSLSVGGGGVHESSIIVNNSHEKDRMATNFEKDRMAPNSVSGSSSVIAAMKNTPLSEAAAITARVGLSAALPGRQCLSNAAAALLISRSLSTRSLPGPGPGGAPGWSPATFHWRHDVNLCNPTVSPLGENEVLAFLSSVAASRVPVLSLRAQSGQPFDGAILSRRLEVLRPVLHRLSLPGGHHFHLDALSAPDVASGVAEFLSRGFALG